MKQIYLFGNWKSNKTISESFEWVTGFAKEMKGVVMPKDLTAVVCAPYTSLYALKNELRENSLPVKLAAQDISEHDEGAYTGEISAQMIKELADWVVVGHSERRKYYHETDEELTLKVKEAKSVKLKVIYCVSDADMPVPEGVDVIAYEPIWAIGTGKTDTPENAESVIKTIKEKTHVPLAVYGGSVKPENIASFVKKDAIDGVLPGGASLEPKSFADMIRNVIS